MALRFLSRLRRSSSGATAVEFALLLPVILLFLFAVVDVGWFAWQINQYEKATQVGARMAVVTDPVSPGLASEAYVGKIIGGNTLAQGDPIPAAALGLITCTSSTCTCTTAPCPATLGYTSAAFTRIATRMKQINPQIDTASVLVQYSGSGLGFAGDPSGMEIAPLVTVRLKNKDSADINSRMQFRPITAWVFKAAFNLPSFSYSLPMEDGSGSVSS